MNALTIPGAAPLSTRQEFGASSMQLAVAETSAQVMAAQAKAMVEARYIMALQRPRNWDQVRQDLMRECRRPTFAHNPSAYYRKPIGKGVEGLGIRFVEVAFRCMKNVLTEPMMIFEDETKEISRVSVTDLEANVTYSQDVRVSKTVERSKPMDDGSYISVRTNSFNKPVYTVLATDDDLLNKRAALISKAVRTLGLRLIPGDMQDEAEQIIKAVRLDEAAKDPDAERKRIGDAFAGVGVKASDLVEYLGHSLDTCSPPELVNLRALYGAIKDGEATWRSVMENKRAEQGSAGAPPSASPSAPPGVGDLNAAAATAKKSTSGKAAARAADPPAGADPQTGELTRLQVHLKRMDEAAAAGNGERLADLTADPGPWTDDERTAIDEHYRTRAERL